jgi:hypothetical protein
MRKTLWFAAGFVLACTCRVLAVAQEAAINSSEQRTEKVYKSTEVSLCE